MLLAVTASSAAWAANTLNLSYEVVGLYDDKSYYTPNYYIVLSTVNQRVMTTRRAV